MNNIPNVKILVSKCVRTKKLYGMRMEETSRNYWNIDWAFPLSDYTASVEKYTDSTVTGSFNLDKRYPGCPHCGNISFYRCICGKIACWDGISKSVTCPYCNNTGDLMGVITELKTGGDR